MSIIEIPIPEHVRGQLASNRAFVLKSIDSWRAAASATVELVRENFARLRDAEPDEKDFYGWEIVSAGVEVIEMLASVIQHTRSPGTSVFHTVENPAMRGAWESLQTEGLSRTEVASLLGLLLPKGFNLASVRLARVHEQIVSRAMKAISELALFWLESVDNARWWRHLPMSFTWEESLTLWPDSSADRDAVRCTVEATPEKISAFCRLDEQEKLIEHTALRMRDVRTAMRACDIASQLIINMVSNQNAQLLDLHPPVRHLFPFFTTKLTSNDRRILVDAGYTLV